MRLLKALVMATAIMMMSQAAMAADWGICSDLGGSIECDNTPQYASWIVGKYISDDYNRVYACARVLGEWELVGWADYNDHSYLAVEGCNLGEKITMVPTTSSTYLCDFDDSSNATAFPSYWFPDGIAVHGYNGIDYIKGSYRDEHLYGDNQTDHIWGNGGGDYIDGGDGIDTLWGITGVNYIYGGEHDDTINGGDMVDYIWGENGNDIIYGNDGNDQLHGGAGRDFMYGGDGDDTLWGDADGDQCWGNDHVSPLADTCYCEREYPCCEF